MRKIFELVNKNLSFSRLNDLLFKKKTATDYPLITISRETGSGGRLVAYLVQKKLGRRWKIYHKNLVSRIAKEANLEKKLIEEIDEKKVSAMDKIIEEALGKRYPSLSTYYKHLVKILSAIGQKGYAVVVGRGANFLFLNSLDVRIICDIKQKVKWIVEYEKVSQKEAEKRIEKSDKDRFSFIKDIYGHDIRKAHHYDLVIKTGDKLSIDDAAKLIVLAAKKRFNL